MDKRKRTRCKICKKRVNLAYTEGKGIFAFGCPNCGGHGEMNERVVTKK